MIEIPISPETPVTVELTATALGEAWIRVAARLEAERRGLMDQIAAANAEVYVSPDDRAMKVAELTAKKRRLDDDLIAIGQVHSEAIRAVAEMAVVVQE